MINKKNILMLILWIAVLVSIFLVIKFSHKKIGFVQNDLVFTEFKGKKDYEKILFNDQQKKKNILDSIAIEINLLRSKSINTQNEFLIKNKEDLYTKIKQEFVQSDNESYNKYMEEIWKQINQYIMEYGKENNYQYILGVQGAGNVMYANPDENISKEIIEYINKKYEGKK
jgi:outer membrane protein